MATRLPEKQNFLQKFAGIFIPDDPQEMKSYIWMNIIVPGIKNALYSTVGAALGINRPNYPGYGMYNSYNYGYSYPHSYGTYQNYSSYTQAAYNPPATNSGYKTGIFAFSTKVEAIQCLNDAKNAINDQQFITVNGFIDICNTRSPQKIKATPVDSNYGWTSLDTARVVPYGQQFMIRLPKPVCLV